MSELRDGSPGARQVLATNFDLLWWTRAEMMRRYRRKKAREAKEKKSGEEEKRKDAEGEHTDGSSVGSGGDSSDDDARGEADPEQPDKEVPEVVRDPRPPLPGDDPNAGGGEEDDWAGATLEQQASASCVPGRKTTDRITAASTAAFRSRGAAAVNPPSSEYTWDEFESCMDFRNLLPVCGLAMPLSHCN